ncbi:MAG: ornithine cyclodeaminase family protein [Actinomycetota bacterium]
MLRVLDGPELARALPMRAAIDALDTGLRAPFATTPLRTVTATAAGTLLLMPAFTASALGVKLVTLTEGNADRGLPFLHATYVLSDGETQAPRAVLDGTALTALRTAAMSGLATRYLARAAAPGLVLVGAGALARPHVEAMRAVRPIEEVVVVTRGRARGEALVADLAADGLAARLGTPEDLAIADVLCTCTTSPTPVVDGARLAAGVHVNAVGAYTATTRELDGATLARAEAIVVETEEILRAECGAVLLALAEGSIRDEARVVDLRRLLDGASLRTSPSAITVFLSSGAAFEDLVVATAAVAAAEGAA